MSRFFATILLTAVCISPISVNAQTKTIYYDSNWKKTTKDNASYYRTVAEQPGGKYYAQDHYLNGHLQMTGYYTCASLDDSCQTGPVVYYDSLGNITSEGEYRKGKNTGIWKAYYPHSANLMFEENHQPDTSLMLFTLYDSVLHHKIGEGRLLHGKKDSLWCMYYANSGSLKSTTYYKNDKREGAYTEYDAGSNTPILRGKYHDDKKTGVWGYYTSAGETYIIINFKDGLEDGVATYYDSNSHKKRIEFNFRNGKKEGVATISLSDDHKSIAMHFKDDKLDGDQFVYYPNGNVQRIEHYKNGILWGGKCFDKSGASIPCFSSDGYKLSLFNNFHLQQFAKPSAKDPDTHIQVIKPLIKNDTTFYSIDGDKTDWNYAEYYRVIYANPTDTGYKLEERYIARNRLKLSTHTISSDSIIYNGPFVSFDKKGYKDEEGLYNHGLPTGISKNYYPGTDTLWYQVTYGKEGGVTLISYYRDGKIKRRQNNMFGQYPGGICYDENGKEIPFTPFWVLPKSSVDISSFLGHNLRYPEDALENNIQGRVILKFVVLKDGSISKIHVLRGIGGGCDEEAMRVLALMPKWIPGMDDDKPVDIYYTFPITFKLE